MHYRRTAMNLRREPRAERLITAAIGLLITLICRVLQLPKPAPARLRASSRTNRAVRTGAAIKVVNEATGVGVDAFSNEQGLYEVAGLVPGQIPR